MADWSILDHEWPPNQFDPYQYDCNTYIQEKPPVQYMPSQAQSISPPSPTMPLLRLPEHRGPPMPYVQSLPAPKGDNPREIRNRAEKQRRDKLNHSIAELASMVPPVVAASRKIDKTGILRLTAHFLRSHNYVFGDSIDNSQDFSPAATQTLLALLNGFLLTCTYKGLVVVASQNIQQYLGYTELELLGQSIFNIIHEQDRQMVREQLMPKSQLLGSNGELLIPDEPNGKQKVADALAREKRRFIVRFKKLSQRSEPCQYVTCHVEGSLRKSDRACRGYSRCCQMVRRARARGDNPCSSGNDIVFVGVVRPVTDTFATESGLESFRMEYRTRHSIDGQIIQSEQRIALVTGYMTHEVNGVNAMNFMHRDDVRWVIIALREMYDQHRLVGESCYRLMTKNGQFIYMRTRGRLDVDVNSRSVTSFVCTNTVVAEEDGIQLIKQMKKKFAMMVNNSEELPQEEEPKEVVDNQALNVEDPSRLKKVILHLVTDLPSIDVSQTAPSETPERESSPSLGLAIIPPKKENIVSAIDKIYTVIAKLPKNRIDRHMDRQSNLLTAPVKTIKSVNPTMYSSPQASTSTAILPTYNNVYPQYARDNITTIVSHKSVETVETGSYGTLNSIRFAPLETGSKSNDPIQDINQPANIKYNINHSDPEDDNNEKVVLTDESRTPHTGIGLIGVKRSGNFQDENIASKKKNAELPEHNAVQEIAGSESVDNEVALPESLLNNILLNMPSSQIDNALSSLEQTIKDPTFPDLLNSPDVQDIFSLMENELEDGNSVT